MTSVPVTPGVRVVRGAPHESSRAWATVFHEPFGGMLTFWPPTEPTSIQGAQHEY
jgi:hypothetical protein